MPYAGRLQSQRNAVAQALLLHRQGRVDEAEKIYLTVLADRPDCAEALHPFGVLRHQQGRNVEALELIGTALKHAAKSADILNNYGLVLAALGRHLDALAYFEQALAICSEHINALNNRADALARLKREEDALAAYQRVLAVQPDHLGALNECGGLNRRLGRLEAAVACYDRALAVAPAAEVYVNKGTALRTMNRDREALASFVAAAALKPDCAEAHWNASLIHLRRGDFVAGWRDYEWRWRKADWAARRRNFAMPLWLGKEPIEGKTLLLHAEQGLGDTIQFVRYAPLVVRRGADVVLECQSELKALLQGIEGVGSVIARGEVLPPFDFHCPLLSLPVAFATELATIPAEWPYIRSDQQRMARWRDRVPQRGRLRVGLCWAGSSAHRNDHNRSIPLQRFASVLAVNNVDFVSLQKELSDADAETLCQHQVLQLGRQFEDFADTAAVLEMLDLVIAVDTSVAHLAGAMGKAVALLLPFSPDWRWMLDRTDSPWYPTMRLFRQAAPGDWNGPLDRICRELAALVVRRAKTAP